ncbi:TetR/AcrR family transcriptional regulator [Mesorhizobium kowhaii]|uniref:TetR family transcriptional regulator n=1 Tax=Mesorhizobium kowhaii TaxID=1300272 RepID=A0A2W7C925_9HYPH|nr:TetR family transcriptional regulator [Mesorhizobium kowhaii]PZV39682.1 TetR family transcriptional regulator [Mesorhizobium kowhaii]
MDNVSRSERSRSAIIQAALAIIARDGPGRLTLDAIAREGGLSKGGVMHQFRTKEAVLKTLLENQVEFFENFSRDYLASADMKEAQLSAQIAVQRKAIAEPHSVAFGLLGALAENPALLSGLRETDARKVEAIRSEAADPDLATLRLFAAKGIALSTMMGICSLSDEDRERLFERLLDNGQWPDSAAAKDRPTSPSAGD